MRTTHQSTQRHVAPHDDERLVGNALAFRVAGCVTHNLTRTRTRVTHQHNRRRRKQLTGTRVADAVPSVGGSECSEKHASLE
jgi:hypothetical protein